ncbi:MAG: SDR family oxidoreductase [Chlamydiales bacterium]
MILVTGAAKGLGKEICCQLAAKGHDLVIHYRQSEKEAKELKEVCQGLGVQAEILYGDFSTTDSLEAFIQVYLEQIPLTKGLVNNVGNYLIAPLADTEKHQWHDLFQTNLFAPIFLVQALLPFIQKEKGGIVNLGVSGLNPARPFLKAGAYATAKSALWFYTLSMAKQLAPHMVNVNMVSPGYLEETAEKPNPNNLPMRRLITFQEIARVVAFLFEAKSSSITGQNIEVAGGV